MILVFYPVILCHGFGGNQVEITQISWYSCANHSQWHRLTPCVMHPVQFMEIYLAASAECWRCLSCWPKIIDKRLSGPPVRGPCNLSQLLRVIWPKGHWVAVEVSGPKPCISDIFWCHAETVRYMLSFIFSNGVWVKLANTKLPNCTLQ